MYDRIFINDNNITMNTLKSVIHTNIKNSGFCTEQNGKHSETYSMCECGFDIETTNTTDKKAFMYKWQMTINHKIFHGRTWEQFYIFIETCKNILYSINKKAKLLVWVANLPFEFQFMRKRFNWSKIFAKQNRQIVTAETDNIIFHECLSISGQGGLKNLAKNYCKTQKASGDLDYTIMRNSNTELTENELHYCDNDVIILSEFAHYIFTVVFKQYKRIPLTITQTLRWDMKQAIKDSGKKLSSIYNYIRCLYPETKEQYQHEMQYLFRGGYTHANALYVDEILKNVSGADYTSSYPAVMVHGYYPISKFRYIDVKANRNNFTNLLKIKCCIFTVRFWNIKATTTHSIESESKIIESFNLINDNGRLRYAEYIEVRLTELDYETYKEFYTWDDMEIMNFAIADRGKLPDYLIKTMLHNYITKCKLKAEKKDDTVDYVNAKAKTNSFYGCTVTQLNFIEYALDANRDWVEIVGGEYDNIIKRQILSPYWGIYVTAHARRNLLKTVYKIHDYVIYCDTDSIYYTMDVPTISETIDSWNAEIELKNKALFTNDEFTYLHDLGAFDTIGIYDKFKTLGAKRYIKYGINNGKKDKKLHVTIAGLPKKDMENYMKKYNITNAFELFSNNMCIPSDVCSKLLRTYNDEPTTAQINDGYCIETMHEYTSTALNANSFTLTMSEVFLSLIPTIKALERIDLK